MGRPIKKSRMLSDFNPSATATLAVSNYRVGGSNTAGTGSYIVSQRSSKKFKIHLNDSSEAVFTLVTKATLTDNGTFNVKVILDDSAVAYNTIHYVTTAGATGTIPYTLKTTEGADEGQDSGKGNIDIRTH
jgi:secreted trypsin-like serine protease